MLDNLTEIHQISQFRAQIDNSEFYPSIERHGNVAIIRKKEGTYSLIYGDHRYTQNPRDIPDNTSGLVLETGLTIWTKNPLGYINAFKEHIQYKYIMKKCEAQRIPIIFADFAPIITGVDNSKKVIPGYTLNNILIAYPDGLSTLAETYIGAKMLVQLKDIKLERRSILKSGLGLVGIYFMGPLFAQLSGEVDFANTKTAEIEKVILRYHPEFSLVIGTIRNTIIAQKERWLIQANWLNTTPNLSTVLGSEHIEIEDQIMTSEKKRMEFLEAVRPLLKVVANRETFSRVAMFNFDGIEWKIGAQAEIPELKALLA